MHGWLAGRRILVTGSSQGIGRAAGEAMARAGARVAFTSEKPADALPADFRDSLATLAGCCYLAADLSDDAQASRLIVEAAERLGGLDVLVNNLGTFREPDFLGLTYADFERVFRVNVWAGLNLSRLFVEQLGGRPGRIIFSSSLNATRSEPGHALYDASKGAVSALCRQLAVELAPLGVTTATVAPGLVETPLTDFGLRSDPEARRVIEGQIPLGRIATVDDVAAWYVFLAGEGACYSTGSTFVVDGGLDAQQMPSRPIAPGERAGSGE